MGCQTTADYARILCLAIAGMSGCLGAEPGACKNTPELDYWLGDWTVTSPDAPGTGHSKVYQSLDGCVLRENWSSDTSAHGGENTLDYDADAKRWYGLFVDNHGRVHAMSGTAGAAGLEGPARDENGRPALKRVRIVRVDDNHTQQMWEESADSGATWKTEYRMDYLRRKP
jgi:hypothetical protein